MPTTSICGTVRGNRRSDNIPEGAGGSAAGDATVRIAPAEPQISSQGLQFTGFSPIKPLPSIKEVVEQTRTLAQPANTETAPQPATVETVTQSGVVETQDIASPQPANTETVTQSGAVETQDIASPQPANTETVPQPEPEETQNLASPQPTSTDTESFEDCWKQMVDAIFQKKPAFYHQLYDYLPGYENDIITVDVENDFQKNQLEMSKRAMLEFWRNHFQLNVDDIEFVIREHERKKVIYTSEDKVNNMLEQNPALKDFLQVLNFRIKD